jgi:hypothetical protein
MIRRAPLCAALTLAGLLALPPACFAGAPASAWPKLRALVRERTHMSAQERAVESRLELDAGHGYRLAVIGERDTVFIEIARPASFRQDALKPSARTAQAFTIYIARGTVTPRRIAASFGKFGKLDVRFHPSGQVVESPPRRHCKGVDHFTSRHGVFTGRVRFEGEEHYVAVRSHRARGRVRSPIQLSCASSRFRSRINTRARPVRQPSSPGSSASFTASARHGIASTELFVFGNRHKTTSVAVVEESIGSVAEIRYGLSVSHQQTFTLNDALTSATLAPPAPFHGTGTYRAAPDGTRSWTGPLSVSFPGASRWPLTGDEFKASLHAGF